MAKLRTYLVSFNPASKKDGILSVQVRSTETKHEVQASNFVDLEAEVRKLAHAFGQSCSPCIRLKDSKERNPAGFDKWAYGYDRSIGFIEYA